MLLAVKFLKSGGQRVFLDAEHFFDGSPSNSIGMLKGIGASISISSINCVFDLILESPLASIVTKTVLEMKFFYPIKLQL